MPTADGNEASGQQAFRGMVFTRYGLPDAVWPSLQKGIAGKGGAIAVAAEHKEAKMSRGSKEAAKKALKLSADSPRPVAEAPTHVVISTLASPKTRDEAQVQTPKS